MKKLLYDDSTCGSYEIMMNYNKGFTFYQLNVLANKENKHRESILIKKYPNKDQWIITDKNNDLYINNKHLIFYIKKIIKFIY